MFNFNKIERKCEEKKQSNFDNVDVNFKVFMKSMELYITTL